MTSKASPKSTLLVTLQLLTDGADLTTNVAEGPSLLRKLLVADGPVLAREDEARALERWLAAARHSEILRSEASELTAAWSFPHEPPISIELDGRLMATAAPLPGVADQGWLLRWSQGGEGALPLLPLAPFVPAELDSDSATRDFALGIALDATLQHLVRRFPPGAS